jgi:hypothetical protein
VGKKREINGKETRHNRDKSAIEAQQKRENIPAKEFIRNKFN